LSCSPADPLLWLVLYWVETTRNGFRAEYVRYIEMSYKTGPREGWVAQRRNRLALAIFPQLPDALAAQVVDEFAKMLNSGFVDDAVQSFVGPGWPERNRLLPELRNVSERYRQVLANEVYKLGYDIDIPGISRRDPRPWR
jgi:hypothetical protein